MFTEILIHLIFFALDAALRYNDVIQLWQVIVHGGMTILPVITQLLQTVRMLI